MLIRQTIPLRIGDMRTPSSEGASCLQCHRAIERVEEHTYFVEATRIFICPYCHGEQELPDSTPASNARNRLPPQPLRGRPTS